MKSFCKSLLAVLLLFACAPALAALRGYSVVVSSTNCAGPCTIADTYAGANGVQVGDEIIIVTAWTNGNSTPGSVTDPSAFTSGGSLSPSIPTTNIDTPTPNAFMHIAVKTAASGDVGFQTYSTTLASGGYYSQMIVVESGRSGTINNQIVTATSGESTSNSFSYSVSGLTALTGDDVLVFIAGALPAGNGAATFSASIPGYTNSLNSSGGGTYTPPMMFLDNLNVSSGAFGPLAATITTSTTLTLAQAAFTLSIPAAGSSFTPGVVLSNGHILLSNGHPVVQ